MNVTKTLAEIQAKNPHAEDRQGFGTAHYGLGLLLAAMWEDPSMIDDQQEIVEGAAFLLWKHKRQAEARGITGKMIGLIIPGVDWWKDSKLVTKTAEIRSLAGRRLVWELRSNPVRLIISGVGDNQQINQALQQASAWCKVPVETLFGNKTLTIAESHIWRLMQFAATSTNFRGLFPVGAKYSFDQLALHYLPPPKSTIPAAPLVVTAKAPNTAVKSLSSSVPHEKHELSKRELPRTAPQIFAQKASNTAAEPASSSVGHENRELSRGELPRSFFMAWWQRLALAIRHL